MAEMGMAERMKRRDYILAQDLTRLRIAEQVLGEIIAPQIGKREKAILLTDIRRMIGKLNEAMGSEAIK